MAAIFNKDKKDFIKCKATPCPQGKCGIPWKDYKKMLEKGEVHSGGLPHKCEIEQPPVHHVSEPAGIFLVGVLVVAFVLFKLRRRD